MQKPWDRENAHSRQYVEQLKSLANKHKAGFVDIFEEWQKDPNWADKLLLPDKLHLSNQGNQLLWKQMQEAIAAQVPPMAWENVALHYPLMDAIDKVSQGSRRAGLIIQSSQGCCSATRVEVAAPDTWLQRRHCLGGSNARLIRRNIKVLLLLHKSRVFE